MKNSSNVPCLILLTIYLITGTKPDIMFEFSPEKEVI